MEGDGPPSRAAFVQRLADGGQVEMKVGCELGTFVIAGMPQEQREGEGEGEKDYRRRVGVANLEAAVSGVVVQLDDNEELDTQWLKDLREALEA